MNSDVFVTEYLGRLETAAGGLPADRRAELISEVREHIRAALADAGSTDEVTVRNVLERLGPPEEIAAEAAPAADASGPPVEAAPPARTGWGRTEVLALVAFVGAWVALALQAQLTLWTSLILWLVLGALGVALTAVSDRWSPRRKRMVIGTFAVLYLLAALVILAVTPVSTSGGGAPAPTITVQTGS